jgi:hypothetical protein
MNAHRLIQLVQENEDGTDLYAFAAVIAAEQRELDAKVAESLSAADVASAIRASP